VLPVLAPNLGGVVAAHPVLSTSNLTHGPVRLGPPREPRPEAPRTPPWGDGLPYLSRAATHPLGCPDLTRGEYTKGGGIYPEYPGRQAQEANPKMILSICFLSEVLSRRAGNLVEGVFVVQLPVLPDPVFPASAPPEPAMHMAAVLGDKDGADVVRILEHGVHLRVFDADRLHGSVGISPNKGTPEAWEAFDAKTLGPGLTKGHFRELVSPELEQAVIQPIRLIEKPWPQEGQYRTVFNMANRLKLRDGTVHQSVNDSTPFEDSGFAFVGNADFILELLCWLALLVGLAHRHLIRMAKIDLDNAYYRVRVAASSQLFLAFFCPSREGFCPLWHAIWQQGSTFHLGAHRASAMALHALVGNSVLLVLR
jgi:hypothetical protein